MESPKQKADEANSLHGPGQTATDQASQRGQKVGPHVFRQPEKVSQQEGRQEGLGEGKEGAANQGSHTQNQEQKSDLVCQFKERFNLDQADRSESSGVGEDEQGSNPNEHDDQDDCDDQDGHNNTNGHCDLDGFDDHDDHDDLGGLDNQDGHDDAYTKGYQDGYEDAHENHHDFDCDDFYESYYEAY